MRKRILVVGAGVIGLCVAYYARLDGHEVTVIERENVNNEGTSHGNAGMVVPSHFVPLSSPGTIELGLKWLLNPESPFALRPSFNSKLLMWVWHFWKASTEQHVQTTSPLLLQLNRTSLDLYEQLAIDHGNPFHFEKKGLLMLCQSESGLQEEIALAETAKTLGLLTEILSAREAAQLEPNIAMNVAGAVYFPEDAHLSPKPFMDSLQDWLSDAGVTFRWNTEVVGWRTNGRTVEAALTSNETLTADEYVVCSGVWSSQLLRDLAVTLPMQPGKGYSLTIQKPRHSPSIPAMLTEARVAVTPMGKALRFAGTMELAASDLGVDVKRIRGIKKAIPTYYPDLSIEDFDDVPVWSGLRPCSPDGLPFVGRFERYNNLSVAAGHAMMGLSLGPITGRLISDVLADRESEFSLKALRPDRYAGSRLDRFI